MAIKEKITPQLKSRFLEEIRKTMERGKERGLFLCIDDKEALSPDKTCEGDDCSVELKDPAKACIGKKVQGEFHTHPYLFAAKKTLAERGEIIPSDDMLKERMKNNIRLLHERRGIPGITIESPSYSDLVLTLLSKCFKQTNGTMCTGSDLDDDKIECWTPKDVDKVDRFLRHIQCHTAAVEIEKSGTEEGSFPIKPWIVPIFEREIIHLKNKSEYDKR